MGYHYPSPWSRSIRLLTQSRTVKRPLQMMWIHRRRLCVTGIRWRMKMRSRSGCLRMAVPATLIRLDVGLMSLKIVKRVVIRGEPATIDACSRYVGWIRARIEVDSEKSRRETRRVKCPALDADMFPTSRRPSRDNQDGQTYHAEDPWKMGQCRSLSFS